MFKEFYKSSVSVLVLLGFLGTPVFSMEEAKEEKTPIKQETKSKNSQEKHRKAKQSSQKKENLKGIDLVPQEVLALILSECDPMTQAQARLVCGTWKNIVDDMALPLNTFGKFLQTRKYDYLTKRQEDLSFWLKRRKFKHLTQDLLPEFIPHVVGALEDPEVFTQAFPDIAGDPLTFALLAPSMVDLVAGSLDHQEILKNIVQATEIEFEPKEEEKKGLRKVALNPKTSIRLKAHLAALHLLAAWGDVSSICKLSNLQAMITTDHRLSPPASRNPELLHSQLWFAYFRDTHWWASQSNFIAGLYYRYPTKMDPRFLERLLMVFRTIPDKEGLTEEMKIFISSQKEYLIDALAYSYEERNDNESRIQTLQSSASKSCAGKANLAEAFQDNNRHAEALKILEPLCNTLEESPPRAYLTYLYCHSLLYMPYHPETYQKAEANLDNVLKQFGKKKEIKIEWALLPGLDPSLVSTSVTSLSKSDVSSLKACFALYTFSCSEREALKTLKQSEDGLRSGALLKAIEFRRFSSLQIESQKSINKLLKFIWKDLGSKKEIKEIQSDPSVKRQVDHFIQTYDSLFSEIFEGDKAAKKKYQKVRAVFGIDGENKKEKETDKVEDGPSFSKDDPKCIVS
jgi:hypothetical protein